MDISGSNPVTRCPIKVAELVYVTARAQKSQKMHSKTYGGRGWVGGALVIRGTSGFAEEGGRDIRELD